MHDGKKKREARENTDPCWMFEVYARGRRFTVETRFFSLVACCAWCLDKRTLTWRRGEKGRIERTCMDNFSPYSAERGCELVRGYETGETHT